MEVQSRIVTYAMAIAQLVTDDTLTDKMRNRKFSAVQKAAASMDAYAQEGVREDLVDTTMEKKARLILNAKTLEEVDRAADPPKPHYTGGEWIDDPLSVPEEELVIWSRTSLKGPLTRAGQQRYLSVFKKVFGWSPDEAPVQT